MKKKNFVQLVAVCISMFVLTTGCNNVTTEKTEPAAKADLVKIKAEIQELESSWAAADNARDTNAVAAFYADDAVSMSNDKPSISGKEAIRKDIAEGLSKRTKGSTLAYDVIDVFGDDNVATETGKITTKDSTGKVTYTGKYMAVWEKRDGKFICVRDISNDDAKEK